MKLVPFVVAFTFSCAGAWKADPPYYAQVYTTATDVRGLFVDVAGDILAVSGSNVRLIYDRVNNGQVEVVNTVLVNGTGLTLNHGIAYLGGYLYASSTSTVYRWPYTPGQRTPVTAEAQVVINEIPTGGHLRRTLVFDAQGQLYVHCGSDQNVDQNSDRARIRRFSTLNLPLAFTAGEVFADGLRNEVGLGFDLQGVLHGVENGADNLFRDDLGGDIHNGNPAEELNRFDQPVGQHYGYPYCFSTYDLRDYASGTQFAWPDFMNDGVHDDAYCRNATNNRPPTLTFPAHHAPLGINFNRGKNCEDFFNGAFPCSMTGDAAVAFHGGWNMDIKGGYKVQMVRFNSTTGLPTGVLDDVIYEENTAGCRFCFRPVNAVFDNRGHLIVSADATGEIFRVTYGVPPPEVISA